MDLALDDIHMNKNQQLRDSISSIMSMDRSASGSATNTPGSSPASSVIMAPIGGLKRDASPGLHASGRRSSSNVGAQSRSTSSRRHFSMPPGSFTNTNLPKKTAASRTASSDLTHGRSSPSSHRPSPSTSAIAPWTPRPAPPPDNRPRWNSSPRVDYLDYSSKPRPYLHQSPTLNRKHSKSDIHSPITPASQTSAIPTPSPLGRSSPALSRPLAHRPRHSTGNTSASSARRPSTATSHQTPPSSSHSNKAYLDAGPSPAAPNSIDTAVSPSVRSRPPTSMGGRRISLIPVPKNPTTPVHGLSGRESAIGHGQGGVGLGPR